MIKFSKKKRCPRCNNKCEKSLIICPSCSLNFNKLDIATNKEAKKALNEKDYSRVVYREGCPSDVSRVKLILLTIFLGFVGAHFYYVGRYKKGILYTCSFIIGVVYSLINSNLNPSGDAWEVFTLLAFVWAIVTFMWINDIIKVCLNKFKIPVSISRT